MTGKIDYRQWRFEDMTADEALSYVARTIGGEVSTGFVLSPERACFCTLQTGDTDVASLSLCDETEEEKQIGLGAVFEFRLFGPNFDARWERADGLKGDLQISSDTTVDKTKFEQLEKDAKENKVAVPYVVTRENRYLLWGELADVGDGRTKLTSARIGTLWAPVESSGKRIQLTAIEYFGTKKYGNAVFVGERLTGFEAVPDNAKASGASQ
jgi:CRISPR-associated protein (TIGR03984 family)